MADQRRFSRMNLNQDSADSRCTVTFRDSDYEGSVVDMSINGLGIVGIEAEELQHAEPVTVEFQGAQYDAYCCSANRGAGGANLKIGVQHSGHVKKQPLKLIARFVDCGSFQAGCEVLSVSADTATVRLRTGDQLDVKRESLRPMTISERIQTLEKTGDEEQLKKMLVLYALPDRRLGGVEGIRKSIASVIKIEFSS